MMAINKQLPYNLKYKLKAKKFRYHHKMIVIHTYT